MILKHWPIIATVAIGLVGFGVLKADVSNTVDEVAKLKTDRELLIRVDERVQAMQKDIDQIKEAVKDKK
jgi:hypothetical protein